MKRTRLKRSKKKRQATYLNPITGRVEPLDFVKYPWTGRQDSG